MLFNNSNLRATAIESLINDLKDDECLPLKTAKVYKAFLILEEEETEPLLTLAMHKYQMVKNKIF